MQVQEQTGPALQALQALPKDQAPRKVLEVPEVPVRMGPVQ